jgi:hypothetical protein
LIREFARNEIPFWPLSCELFSFLTRVWYASVQLEETRKEQFAREFGDKVSRRGRQMRDVSVSDTTPMLRVRADGKLDCTNEMNGRKLLMSSRNIIASLHCEIVIKYFAEILD